MKTDAERLRLALVNILTNAPHTLVQVAGNEWTRPYTREQAAFRAKVRAWIQGPAAADWAGTMALK